MCPVSMRIAFEGVVLSPGPTSLPILDLLRDLAPLNCAADGPGTRDIGEGSMSDGTSAISSYRKER